MGRICEAVVSLARTKVGIREKGGRNAGPEVEEFLRAVGLPAGQPWCAAAAFTLYRDAARHAGLVNPIPKSGKAVRLYHLSEMICRVTNPVPGCLYVLDHEFGKPDPFNHNGHAGIVLSLDPLGNVDEEWSGNTNRTGSREGDSTWIHRGPPEVTHGGVILGYLNPDLALQHPGASA